MVHHVAVPLDITLRSGALSHGDALRAVPDQKSQPLPAPSVPLFVMAWERQHNYQFHITVLRLFFQPEYDFSSPLVYFMWSFT